MYVLARIGELRGQGGLEGTGTGGVHGLGLCDTLKSVGDSDADLVRRARGGDLEAFAFLVEAHWTRLVGLARSVVGDVEAEDVVQDALVMAWQRLGSLRDPGAFAGWVRRILTRDCFRRASRRAREVPLAAVAEPPDPNGPSRVLGVDVEQTLAVLAPRQRAVMHMTVIEGMSDSEIGGVLGIGADSVRSHRRRARQRLRGVLGGKGG